MEDLAPESVDEDNQMVFESSQPNIIFSDRDPERDRTHRRILSSDRDSRDRSDTREVR